MSSDLRPVPTHSGIAKEVTPMTPEELHYTLHRTGQPGTITYQITPAEFEKVYLSPQTAVKGNLRKTFGNPTPVAVIGFLLSLTPFACQLLEWRGSGGLGASDIGAYFYFGGLLMLLGGIGEWILGNTFPTIVFMTFGSFWFAFGATLVPGYGAYAAFSPDPVSAPQEGLSSPKFLASFAFLLVFMSLLCVIFLIASVRTNVVFFMMFLLLIPAFSTLAGCLWQNAQGHVATGLSLQHATGGILFVVCLLGWYLLTALILVAVDFPLELPLGDLSTIVKGASDRRKIREQRSEGVNHA